MAHTRLTTCMLVCGGLLLAVVGCGKKDATGGSVRGAVTLDGKPLERGSILFTPTDGAKGSVTGGPIEAGQYCLADDKGAAVGTNRVEIHALRKTGRMIQKPLAPEGQMIEDLVEAIPPRFNSASTLKVEITPGQNTANFELMSQ